MKVYLAGAINGCTDEECKDWRKAAKNELPDTIDPMRNDYRGKEDKCFEQIVEGDKKDIEKSSVVLVNFVRPSVGTSMEILWAWLAEIPVVTVIKDDAPISPWLRYHSTKIVHSFDEAFTQIKDWENEDNPDAMDG